MATPRPQSVVITCPHCGTRYQVPPETIGARGREVACAHCGKTWKAETPAEKDEDTLFSLEEEARLDESFAEAEAERLSEVPAALRALIPKGEVPPPEVMRSIAEIRAAIAGGKASPPLPPTQSAMLPAEKADNKRLDRRQRQLANTLPAVRLIRTLRLSGVALLAVLLVGALLWRVELVRQVPDLAGLYAAVGLPVNVLGLEFDEVKTLTSRRDGDSVLSVSGKIRSTEGRRLPVPPVLVTLLDADDQQIYQWSMVTRMRDIEPGEVIDFSTELNRPPEGAARVQLSFSDDGRRGDAPAVPTTPAHEAGH